MLEKLLETASDHATEWKPLADKFLEGIKEIDVLLRAPITGKDLLNVMKCFDASEEELSEAKLKLTMSASDINNSLFTRMVKAKYDTGTFSLTALTDGITLLKDYDVYIAAKVEGLFKVLNESQNENRFHKGICLRRDVARLKTVLNEPYRNIPYDGKEIPSDLWTTIEPLCDYIDAPLDFSFLECDRGRYWSLPSASEPGQRLFDVSEDILRIKLKLEIRESFVRRLGLFD